MNAHFTVPTVQHVIGHTANKSYKVKNGDITEQIHVAVVTEVT